LETLLKLLIALSLVTFFNSCDIAGVGKINYDDRAGNELMDYINPEKNIEKKAVYVFQLESVNDDTVHYYDSDIKGTDKTKIKFLEKYTYTYRLGDVDSIEVKLLNPTNNEIFSLTRPFESVTFVAEPGTYTLSVKNLKMEKGIRKIFYKPDYDTIRTFAIFNANNDVIFSIITEDECRECKMIDGNFNNFQLDSVDFTSADFQNANLQGANLKYSVLNYVGFLSTKADTADMSYVLLDSPRDLRHSSFVFTKAKGIRINKANLNFTNFFDCDLTYSIIEDSQYNDGDMFSCDLANSILRNNNFTNSSFEWCRFDYSDITGTTFCDSDLKDATFFKTIGDATTLCVPDSARGIKIQ
jgi:uncharacterized protein YjbI with pentapeptide repeats